MAITDDTVSLSINGEKFEGWTGVRVTRGIERVPGDFQISMTERYPGKKIVPIQPGDACMVKIGSDIVLTGYVDRLMPSIDHRGHYITILGRGRCADLVDCSAFADNRQFLNHSILDIATMVAKPFGIIVSQRSPGTPAVPNEMLTADGQVIPQYNVNLTTTPWEIIESISRYACLLAYEDVRGNVVLSQVGTESAASGFATGVNVQAAASVLGLDQRYSEVWGLALAIDNTLPLTPGAPPSLGTSSANVFAREQDPGVPRRRPLVVISEQGYGGQDLTARRAKWEIARRYGRSQAVTITADSWRDAAGDLWDINTLAPVQIPELHLNGVTWLIAEMSFVVDLYRGKVAELTLMPKEAFMPQPPSTLWDGQTMQAMQRGPVAGGSPVGSGLLGRI